MSDDKLKVVTPENLNSAYANTFRCGYSESEFLVEFGHGIQDGEERIINVVSKMTIPPRAMKPLVITLFKCIQEYEKEFGKELEIPSNEQLKSEAE